jgi:sugar lactone lactonase YvrE
VRRVLYWVDILHPAVYRFDPATGRNEGRETGKLVSAVIPAADGRLLVASQDGIEWLDFATGALTPFANPEDGIPDNRLNDAKAGPDGRIWIGSRSMQVDASKPSGALYRIGADGASERKEGGLVVANGLGWSPDGRTFYLVDTIPGIIYAYDADPTTGALSARRTFARLPEAEGRLDGLAVDAEGGVWCAIWDGWRVCRWSPDGAPDLSIDLPVPRPSSIAFGGDDLRTMYITSARTRLPASTLAEAPLSGGLFACKTEFAGTPVRLFGEIHAP